MKKFWLVLTLLFFIISPVSAKEAPTIRLNRARQQIILRYIQHVPSQYTQSARTLAVYLTQPFDNKIEKMQAIAYWIAANIAYDSYKYNNGKENKRNMKYHYDILKARTGICGDFAQLFQEMTQYAGIRGVKFVSGYVVDTRRLQNKYSQHQLGDGHAWNSVNINGYTYYIDTTWMATQQLSVKGSSKYNPWSHKQEIWKRLRTNNTAKTTANIRSYYFLFTPQDEVRKFGEHHFAVSSD